MNSLIVPVNFDDDEMKEVLIRLKRVSMEEVREILRKTEWESVIGHAGTSELLTELLGIQIPVQRKTIYFKRGDRGVHFYLKTRLGEGVVLSKTELSQLDFWWVVSEVL
jgi:hypothetical protein